MVKKQITIEILRDYLGEPEKQAGSEYMWQCPYCQDTHRDNLKFNEDKGVVWCFADESHAPQVLKDIYAEKRKKRIIDLQNTLSESPHIQDFDFRQDNLEGMAFSAHMRLLDTEEQLELLYKKRGLTVDTVKNTKIGIDYNWQWMLPTFEYTTEPEYRVMGFEYRPEDLSKVGLHREKGTPTGLAMINQYSEKTEAIVVVEGYLDGYALLQHLTEKGQAEYYHITTPSNGVNSLFKFISQIEFKKYKKYYLFLDNDDAGISMSQKIMAKYPMFEQIILTCGCKDFNEHYLKCIKAVT